MLISRLMDSELNSRSELNWRSYVLSRHDESSVDPWTRNSTRGANSTRGVMWRVNTRSHQSTRGLGTQLKELCGESTRGLISRLLDSGLNSRSELNSRSYVSSWHEGLSVDSWTRNSTRGVMWRVNTRAYQLTRGLGTQLEE